MTKKKKNFAWQWISHFSTLCFKVQRKNQNKKCAAWPPWVFSFMKYWCSWMIAISSFSYKNTRLFWHIAEDRLASILFDISFELRFLYCIHIVNYDLTCRRRFVGRHSISLTLWFCCQCGQRCLECLPVIQNQHLIDGNEIFCHFSLFVIF